MSSESGDELSCEVLPPSLRNVLDQGELKWCFVGGKGGVGKTTTSCCLSILLSQVREKVLLISTDPAHNLSDAFQQKFCGEPTLVNGFDNLFAMEVDASSKSNPFTGGADVPEGLGGLDFLTDMAGSIPGIDEASAFGEVMKQVEAMDYSVVVFDTAPTGHTLKLLQLPQIFDKALDKFMGAKGLLGGIMGPLSMMSGGGGGGGPDMTGGLMAKVEEMRSLVQRVKDQFTDPDLTTFVCVCIPEFLSLYETERLVQDLAEFEIDSHNIVINQVLFPEQVCQSKLLMARVKMQEKYIKQYEDLYEDFHIVKTPLLPEEVRGIEKLRAFAQNLTKPYSHLDNGQDSVDPADQVAVLQAEIKKLRKALGEKFSS